MAMQFVHSSVLKQAIAAATCCVAGSTVAFSETPRISIYFGEWRAEYKDCSQSKGESYLDFDLDADNEFVTFGKSKCRLKYSNVRSSYKVASASECLRSGFPKELIGTYLAVVDGHLEFTNQKGEAELLKDCRRHT
jgi:hypothetical protein